MLRARLDASAAPINIVIVGNHRRSQRLGTFDAAQGVGEIVGPLLAGILWQTGGGVALFAVRIGIAAVAEFAALRVFRAPDQRSRPAPELGHEAPSEG